MKLRAVGVLVTALLIIMVVGTHPARAETITLTFTVTVDSWCPQGQECVAHNATFPLVVTFDDQPTQTQDVYDSENPYIIRHFGPPSMSPTPLPFLANPFDGGELDSSLSRALYGAPPASSGGFGGYKQGILYSGRRSVNGLWQLGTSLVNEASGDWFPAGQPDMPTAQSLAALMINKGEAVLFIQQTTVLNGGYEPVGHYKGTAISNEVLAVQLIVKPGSGNPTVNLKSKGVLPMAVLSSQRFAATSINVAMLQAGPGHAPEAHSTIHAEDVNGDGLADAVLHFRISELGLTTTSSTIELRATTVDGHLLRAVAAISVK